MDDFPESLRSMYPELVVMVYRCHGCGVFWEAITSGKTASEIGVLMRCPYADVPDHPSRGITGLQKLTPLNKGWAHGRKAARG